MGRVILILCLCFVLVYGKDRSMTEIRTLLRKYPTIHDCLFDRNAFESRYTSDKTELNDISQEIITDVNKWLNEQIALLKNITNRNTPSLVTKATVIDGKTHCKVFRDSIMTFGKKLLESFVQCGTTYKELAASLRPRFDKSATAEYNKLNNVYKESLDCADEKTQTGISQCLTKIASKKTPISAKIAVIERFIDTAKWYRGTLYLMLQNCPFHADVLAYELYTAKYGGLLRSLGC